MEFQKNDESVKNKEKGKAASAIAFRSMQGKLTAVPQGMDVEEVLEKIQYLGDIEFQDPPETIKSDALQYCSEGSRISYIIVNRYIDGYGDTFVMLSLVLDTPDHPVRTEADTVNEDGVLAHVYNVTVPYLSELGYVWFENVSNEIRRKY